jgi:hypothetical protein
MSKTSWLFFYVVSLFTKILIPKALDLVPKLVDVETSNLIKICLTSTFFSFKSNFYEQKKVTTMGSLLSLIVENIFMQYFETLALNSFPLKPKCWFHFVDDTCVI